MIAQSRWMNQKQKKEDCVETSDKMCTRCIKKSKKSEKSKKKKSK